MMEFLGVILAAAAVGGVTAGVALLVLALKPEKHDE